MSSRATHASRLSAATLHRLPAAVARPAYDRAGLAIGIVHLGLSAFHRAHQAVYTDAALAAGDRRWGTLGASLHSAGTRDALVPQDGLYTVLARQGAGTRDGVGEQVRVVGSLAGVLGGPGDIEALLAAMAAPDVRLVSLTVTEKGYGVDPATGMLDPARADVRHDLLRPDAPRSALGVVVEALRRRRAAGLPAFTLLPCDNLSRNGTVLRGAAVDFARLRDPDLGRYLDGELRCPSTTVDRIVPATTEADRARVGALLGLRDEAPVVTEPFSQWVIEDGFSLGRPAWDMAGAVFVGDVAPFEAMKLRLLNGSHSTLAYLGSLAAHATVADAMAAPGFAPLIRGLMDREVTPGLPVLAGFDLDRYKSSLIKRFRNPALHHLLSQIAADGSRKLPQRLLDPIRQRLARGLPFTRLALGVAAWMRHATGLDEAGRPVAVADPLAEAIRRRTAGLAGAAALTGAFLEFGAVFGTDLPADPAFRAGIEAALSRLIEHGAAATVARFDELDAG